MFTRTTVLADLGSCFDWQSVWLGIESWQAVPINFYACNQDNSYAHALAMFRTAILRYNSTVVPNPTASLTNLTRVQRRWHHTFIDPDVIICVIPSLAPACCITDCRFWYSCKWGVQALMRWQAYDPNRCWTETQCKSYLPHWLLIVKNLQSTAIFIWPI